MYLYEIINEARTANKKYQQSFRAKQRNYLTRKKKFWTLYISLKFSLLDVSKLISHNALNKCAT